jgi:hypothetical protein
MDNVQNCDSYVNIPSLQTYKSYLNYFNFYNFLSKASGLHLIHHTRQAGSCISVTQHAMFSRQGTIRERSLVRGGVWSGTRGVMWLLYLAGGCLSASARYNNIKVWSRLTNNPTSFI